MSSGPSSLQRYEGVSPFRSRCDGRFLSASGVLLVLAIVAEMLESVLRPHNPRVLYGLAHLPLALGCSAAICAAGAFYLPLLLRRAESVTTGFSLVSLWGAAVLLWLPVVHFSRFSADDWFLAAAATIRHSLAARPWLAWYALDTVDGNFRPLGTVVYLNHGFSVFGFYAGFFVCILSATLLYFIARKTGASPRLALYATLIFVSRDLLYGPVVWLCSLGDGLVILSGAGCVLSLLCSLRMAPRGAILCHLGAFACFAVALLSKQSAYCIPLLALLTLTLRPGDEKPANTPRQWTVALLTAGVYIMATIGVFQHASSLTSTSATPYPVAFTPDGIGFLLRSVLWFFGPLDFQIIRGFMTLETLLGAAILALLFWAIRRCRSRLGLGKRTFAFFLSASFVSIALFLFLPSRRVPYYADLATLWASLLVAAVLAGPERPGNTSRGSVLVIALVLLGGVSIQLKRTALIPSGTYLGGSYGMDAESAGFSALRQQLREHPHATTLILRNDSTDSIYPAMVCILSREVQNVYVFAPKSNRWFVNSLDGSVPQDTRDSWTDVGAFHWNRPLPSAPVFATAPQVLTVPAPSGK